MNHLFVQFKEGDDRCVHQHVEKVRLEKGGGYTISTPCLKPRSEHPLQ